MPKMPEVYAKHASIAEVAEMLSRIGAAPSTFPAWVITDYTHRAAELLREQYDTTEEDH